MRLHAKNPFPLRFAGWLALLMGAAALPVQGVESTPRVAVLQFQHVGADEAEATAVTEQLRSELVNLRVFTVLDRAQTEAVLGELALQQEGVTDPSQAVAVGKLLNAEYIITGSITRLTGAYQLNARMISTATAEIVRSESVIHRGDFIGLLTEEAPRLAARLAQVEAAPPSTAVAPPVAPPPPPAEESPSHQEATMGMGMGMGMMHGGKSTWVWVMGGMMVMGAAMIASREGDNRTGAALAMGAMGVGMVVYYLLSDGAGSMARWDGDVPPHPVEPIFIALPRGTVLAGVAWRW